jgi:hypothetical protein
MKRLLFLFLLSISVMGMACKKAKGPKNVDSIKQDNSIDSLLLMTATVNGLPWQTDSAYSYRVKNSGNDSGSYNLLISATRIVNDSSTTISFNITGFTGVNDYVINPPVNTATYYIGTQRHFATSGVFSVKLDTGNVYSGTFYFTADTITVTNGTFNVALP